MSILRTFKNLLVSNGFGSLVEYGKFVIKSVQNASDNRAFKKQHPDLELPPAYMLFEAYGMSYRRYFEQGRNTAKEVVELFDPFLPNQGAVVLDWGCGPARLTRHLSEFLPSGSRVRGTDYNSETITWAKHALPGIEFKLCELSPPLPYVQDSTDAIISISILTHLSAKRHSEWLSELARILKPGGVLMVTTHGDGYREILTPAQQTDYDKGELVIQEFEKEGHRLFAAFQPPTTFRNLFRQDFKEISHTPGRTESWGRQQDIWLLQKK